MAGKKPTPVKPAPSSAQHTGSAAPSPKKASAAGKNSEERSTPTKKKPYPEAGAKPKKQQASGGAGTPKKKGKKQQSPGKAEKPAPAATMPTKKQQKEANREKQQGPGKRKRGVPEGLEPRSPNRASGEGGRGRADACEEEAQGQKGCRRRHDCLQLPHGPGATADAGRGRHRPRFRRGRLPRQQGLRVFPSPHISSFVFLLCNPVIYASNSLTEYYIKASTVTTRSHLTGLGFITVEPLRFFFSVMPCAATSCLMNCLTCCKLAGRSPTTFSWCDFTVSRGT
jgi:hypothetical protein